MEINTVTKSTPTLSLNMIPNPGKSRWGKDLPNFRGTIAAPDKEDQTFNVALWSSTYVDGNGQELICLNGSATSFSREESAMDQMRASASNRSTAGRDIVVNNLKLEPGKIVLFEAKQDDGNVAENGKRRADFYGYWNDNGRRVDLGGWSNKSKDGRQTSIVGRTQFPMTKDQGASIEPVSDTEIASMNLAAEAGQEQQAEQETRRRSSRGSR